MAYFNERRSGDPPDPRDPRESVRAGRAGWGAGWWIVFFIVIAFIIWAVAWSWDGRGGRQTAATPAAPVEGNAPVQGGTAALPQITVSQLSQPNQSAQWVNQNVRLNDVQVVARAGDQAFWVSDANGNRLLVVKNENSNALPQGEQAGPANQQVQEGQTVTVSGTVHQISSANELQQQYGVQNTGQLRQGQVYLLAQQTLPQNR